MQKWLEEILNKKEIKKLKKEIKKLITDIEYCDIQFKSLYKAYEKEMEGNCGANMSALDYKGKFVVDNTIEVLQELTPTFTIITENHSIRGKFIKVECPNIDRDRFFIYADTRNGDLNSPEFIHMIGKEMLSHFEEWWPKTKESR